MADACCGRLFLRRQHVDGAHVRQVGVIRRRQPVIVDQGFQTVDIFLPPFRIAGQLLGQDRPCDLLPALPELGPSLPQTGIGPGYVDVQHVSRNRFLG